MLHKTPWVAAMLAGLLLTACGDRVFSRPGSYAKRLAFPSTGNPPDLNDIIRRHPELDGIIMLAPTYNELLERESAERKARGEPAAPEYRINAGSAFAITVTGEPTLGGTFSVGPDGLVDLPLIGEVPVLNRTIREVKQDITLKLRKYYIDPKVSVNAVSITALPGMLLGRPRLGSITLIPGGTIDFIGDETIIRVIAGAGASADWRQVRVMQRPDASRGRPRGRIIVVDLFAFAFGDFRQDFLLQADDVIVLPERWSWWEQFDEGWGQMQKFLNGPFSVDSWIKRYQDRF